MLFCAPQSLIPWRLTDGLLSRQACRRPQRNVPSDQIEAIKQDEAFAARFDILISIPGISTLRAIVILTEMPEPGTLDQRQVASLAGPFSASASIGSLEGKRFICGGRPNLRQALYMPALVAAQFNADLKTKYGALIAARKPRKVAITQSCENSPA